MRQLLFVSLLMWFCSTRAADASPIVNNIGNSSEDSISLSFVCTDSLGNPIAADSFLVLVTSPGGDSVFSERISAASPRLDSSVIGGFPLYNYGALVSDIDGNGAAGSYTLAVTAHRINPEYYNLATCGFQIVGWEPDALGDTVGLTLTACTNMLDSLSQLADSVRAILDTVQLYLDTPVSSRSTLTVTDNIGVDLDNVSGTLDSAEIGLSAITLTQVSSGLLSHVASVTADSIRADSLSFQGEGGSVDSADIASWVWNTPQVNHDIEGSFGSYLDCPLSGLSAGSGAYSLSLVAADSARGQVIPRAAIAVYNTEQSALLASVATDLTGRAEVNLDAGSYILIATSPAYGFPAFDTLTISGAKEDTLYGDWFDPGSAESPMLCRVYGYVYTVSGMPVVNATVSAGLPQGTVRAENILVSGMTVTTTTDSTGYFALDLIPSVFLIPDTSPYEISIAHDGTMLVRTRSIVPQLPNWQLTW